MPRYRISISLIVLVGLFGDGYGQFESSSFNLTGLAATTPFARDYQSLSVNPANLNLETGYDQKTTLGFFDFVSDALTIVRYVLAVVFIHSLSEDALTLSIRMRYNNLHTAVFR